MRWTSALIPSLLQHLPQLGRTPILPRACNNSIIERSLVVGREPYTPIASRKLVKMLNEDRF